MPEQRPTDSTPPQLLLTSSAQQPEADSSAEVPTGYQSNLTLPTKIIALSHWARDFICTLIKHGELTEALGMVTSPEFGRREISDTDAEILQGAIAGSMRDGHRPDMLLEIATNLMLDLEPILEDFKDQIENLIYDHKIEAAHAALTKIESLEIGELDRTYIRRAFGYVAKELIAAGEASPLDLFLAYKESCVNPNLSEAEAVIAWLLERDEVTLANQLSDLWQIDTLDQAYVGAFKRAIDHGQIYDALVSFEMLSVKCTEIPEIETALITRSAELLEQISTTPNSRILERLKELNLVENDVLSAYTVLAQFADEDLFIQSLDLEFKQDRNAVQLFDKICSRRFTFQTESEEFVALAIKIAAKAVECAERSRGFVDRKSNLFNPKEFTGDSWKHPKKMLAVVSELYEKYPERIPKQDQASLVLACLTLKEEQLARKVFQIFESKIPEELLIFDRAGVERLDALAFLGKGKEQAIEMCKALLDNEHELFINVISDFAKNFGAEVTELLGTQLRSRALVETEKLAKLMLSLHLEERKSTEKQSDWIKPAKHSLWSTQAELISKAWITFAGDLHETELAAITELREALTLSATFLRGRGADRQLEERAVAAIDRLYDAEVVSNRPETLSQSPVWGLATNYVA